MRIVKLKDNGDVGETLLSVSNIRSKPELGDSYLTVVDAEGLDEKGDPLAFRLILTRNELRAISQGVSRLMQTAHTT